MESSWGTLVLHPAVLIAAGLECIDSKDARFLNAYRKFFGNKARHDDSSVMLKEEDFHIGGIMNPNDLFIIPHHAYKKYQSNYFGFPCLTKAQIYDLAYKERYAQVIQKIWVELARDLKMANQVVPGSQLFQHLIRPKTAGEIYPKIVALHLCGLGEKLRDAFYLVMERFESLPA